MTTLIINIPSISFSMQGIGPFNTEGEAKAYIEKIKGTMNSKYGYRWSWSILETYTSLEELLNESL